jgi:hypothetical protein
MQSVSYQGKLDNFKVEIGVEKFKRYKSAKF